MNKLRHDLHFCSWNGCSIIFEKHKKRLDSSAELHCSQPPNKETCQECLSYINEKLKLDKTLSTKEIRMLKNKRGKLRTQNEKLKYHRGIEHAVFYLSHRKQKSIEKQLEIFERHKTALDSNAELDCFPPEHQDICIACFRYIEAKLQLDKTLSSEEINILEHKKEELEKIYGELPSYYEAKMAFEWKSFKSTWNIIYT